MLSSTAGLPFAVTIVYTGITDGRDRGHVADAHGNARGRGLDDDVGDLLRRPRLPADQASTS